MILSGQSHDDDPSWLTGVFLPTLAKMLVSLHIETSFCSSSPSRTRACSPARLSWQQWSALHSRSLRTWRRGSGLLKNSASTRVCAMFAWINVTWIYLLLYPLAKNFLLILNKMAFADDGKSFHTVDTLVYPVRRYVSISSVLIGNFVWQARWMTPSRQSERMG